MKVIIIMGSTSDQEFSQKIADRVTSHGVECSMVAASAHKQPLKVLEVIEQHQNHKQVVFVTVAGRSNALSGFVAANSDKPTLACPPFKDKLDMMVNIQSSLQMPSNAPVLTILDPHNCADACVRILKLSQ